MAFPGALIHELDGAGIRQVRYEETSHYALTRQFLLDPSGLVARLLREDEPEPRDAG